jgi:hypothetical protein
LEPQRAPWPARGGGRKGLAAGGGGGGRKGFGGGTVLRASGRRARVTLDGPVGFVL